VQIKTGMMFDFEKLDLYQELKKLNFLVYKKIRSLKELDPFVTDQWKQASLSSLLNLAEGTGRMTSADKQHFYTISRGSVFECVALIELIKELGYLTSEEYDEFYLGYEKVSKMLLGMYRSQS
jgi:four helix bundle protein